MEFVYLDKKIDKMKRLLIALLLFSSPVFAEKYKIYITKRPPSSWSEIIDSEGYYYWFTYGYGPAENIITIY